ncbi:MAG TPA: hypothetical protein VF407_23225 [Polyangiaceae bacterium]
MQQGPPPPEFVPLQVRANIQDRGGFFGIALFFATLVAFATGMAFVLSGPALFQRIAARQHRELHLGPQTITHLTVLAFLEVLCLGGTWMWKKWGLFGYFGLAVVSAAIWFKATGAPPIADLVIIGCMLFGAIPRLHMFE